MFEEACKNCFLENACENCPLTIDWANWKNELSEKMEKEKNDLIVAPGRDEKNAIPV